MNQDSGFRVTFNAKDYLATIDFYTSDLEYKVVSSWEEPESSGTILNLDGPELEILAPTRGDLLPPTFCISIRVGDPQEVCEHLRGRGVAITNELIDQPWGERRFSVTDPNGILINFYCLIETASHP